ncbi:Os01g0829700 [Oryza sativa Japonica Group]|uniref:Os01g0829700 protein n=2 Tax=Oryza sativa subsp. japonica TaxID=39947 RepID=Q0JI24_ORYSJ|nr:hypothetical protein EE612_006609 [Oryza sativa]BAF06604.1 Os01g0829700 [Oryza sativa Japonica Group]BAS75044.1 Os01g0829700 [Oryza sativa Japonica Group]|eukprot:NP_001044690.1 Os01g0829700 [Oryza sativa Japonica Group]
MAGIVDEGSCLPHFLSLLPTLGLPLPLPLSVPNPMDSLLRAFRASVQYFLLASSSDDTPHPRLAACHSSRLLFSPRGRGKSRPPLPVLFSSCIASRRVTNLRLCEDEGLLAPARGDGAYCAGGLLNPQTAGLALQGKNTMSPQALGDICSSRPLMLMRGKSCTWTGWSLLCLAVGCCPS